MLEVDSVLVLLELFCTRINLWTGRFLNVDEFIVESLESGSSSS